MPEYSYTLPTGTTAWKMWRTARMRYPREPLHPEDWFVGQFQEPVGKVVPIRWFEVAFRHGPAPRHYAPPDWDNYQRWRRESALERERARFPKHVLSS